MGGSVAIFVGKWSQASIPIKSRGARGRHARQHDVWGRHTSTLSHWLRLRYCLPSQQHSKKPHLLSERSAIFRDRVDFTAHPSTEANWRAFSGKVILHRHHHQHLHLYQHHKRPRDQSCRGRQSSRSSHLNSVSIRLHYEVRLLVLPISSELTLMQDVQTSSEYPEAP